MDKGTKIYEKYLDAKKVLNNELKRVVSILIEANALECDPPSAVPYLKKVSSWVTNHWRYNEGHETIYCRPCYKEGYKQNLSTATVRVPVRMLGMTDHEIWVECCGSKIQMLESERDKIIERRDATNRKYDKDISDLTDMIDKLKEHCEG